MADLLTIEEAQRLILERIGPPRAEPVALQDAEGRILAETARSLVDLPPFPSSAMDGFALRSADTPARLPIVFRIAAGGVVPDGADAVIPIEYVVEHDNEVEVSEPVAPAVNVRARGSDAHVGDVVLEAGARLGPAQLGA